MKIQIEFHLTYNEIETLRTPIFTPYNSEIAKGLADQKLFKINEKEFAWERTLLGWEVLAQHDFDMMAEITRLSEYRFDVYTMLLQIKRNNSQVSYDTEILQCLLNLNLIDTPTSTSNPTLTDKGKCILDVWMHMCV